MVAAGIFILGAAFVFKNKSFGDLKGSSPGVQALYEEALASEEKNESLKAKEAYQRILSDYSDFFRTISFF